MDTISKAISDAINKLLETPEEPENYTMEPEEDEFYGLDLDKRLDLLHMKDIFKARKEEFIKAFPNEDKLSNYEYNEFVDHMVIASISKKYKIYFSDLVDYLKEELAEWYSMDTVKNILKESRQKLYMYQSMDIPMSWFKEPAEYYRFMSHVSELIRDTKALIKDCEDLLKDIKEED